MSVTNAYAFPRMSRRFAPATAIGLLRWRPERSASYGAWHSRGLPIGKHAAGTSERNAYQPPSAIGVLSVELEERRR